MVTNLAADSGSPINGFPSGPDFLIHEQCGKEKISLFFFINNKPYAPIHDISVADVKDIRNGLKNYAYAIHSMVNGSDVYMPDYNEEPFKKFQMYSNKLFDLIFGNNKRLVERLITYSDRHSNIFISSDLLAIPYEFINVNQLTERDNSEVDLFVNYYRLSRFIPRGDEYFDSDDTIITDINFSFACKEELDSTKKELKIFNELNGDGAKKFKIVDRIKTSKEFFNHSKPIDFNIFHISCHFVYLRDNPTNSYLDFDTFRIHLIDFEDNTCQNIWKNKILIANVCDSGAPLYERDSNIAGHFFMTGIDLLICTGIEIFDKFAGDFTAKLYDNLLEAKEKVSLQEILYNTANHFWTDKKDPLGFFYFSIGTVKTFSFN